MNYSSKFSAVQNSSASFANASVPLQPMVVKQRDETDGMAGDSAGSNRRSDDRLPIMIHAGDVVVIDGNHGHDHIDLRGYSVDDALFHGDTIELHKGTENHFVINYKNVSEAVFANDVSVDL